MPFDLAHGDGAPGAAVAAPVAIIAHGEDMSLWNREGVAVRELRVELPGRELVVRKSVVLGSSWGARKGGKVVRSTAVPHTLGVGAVLDCGAVDVERAILRLDGVAADRDDAFDEVPRLLVKRNEYEHVSSRGFVHVEEFDVRAREADAVDEVADEDTVAHKQGVFHGAGGDLVRLDDEGTHEPEDEYDGD